MKEQIKYDPEDIESLLLHKEYQDLYPEEQAFVLKHLDNKDEYNSMRSMLLNISSIDDHDEIEPQNKTLNLLMEEFVTEEKRGFKWWLNSLFSGIFPQEKSWFLQPGFQMAMALGVVIIGFIYFQQDNSSFENIAEVKPVIKKEAVKPKATPESKEPTTASGNNSIETSEIAVDKVIPNNNNTNSITEPKEKSNFDIEPAQDRADNPVADVISNDNDFLEKELIQEPLDQKNIARVEAAKSEIDRMSDNALEDDMADVEMEESIEETESISSPTPTSTNSFTLDETIGNAQTPVTLETIKTSSNGVAIVATKNLASNDNLIGFLYTAP